MARTTDIWKKHLAPGLNNGALVRFAGALGPTVAALGLQFIAFAITARWLGPSRFGEYAAIQGIAAMCVELVGLGGADLLVRAVARDASQYARYFGNMLLMIGLTFVPVLIVGWLCARSNAGTGITAAYLALGLAGEILVARVSASIEMVMVAHGNVVRASLVRNVAPAARLICAAAYFYRHHVLHEWILVIFAQAVVVSLALIGLAIITYGRPGYALFLNQWRSGTAFATNQFARASQSNLDRVVLSYFTTAAALGVYAAGSRVLQLGLFPLQITTRILYPQFFVHGAKGIASARRFGMANLPLMFGTGLFAAAMVAGAGLLAPALLGQDFARSSHTTILLSLSLPLIALQYLAADVLTGAGYQSVRALIYALTAVIFGLVLVLGAKLGGVNGMIASYLSAHVLLAVALWVTAFSVRDRTL